MSKKIIVDLDGTLTKSDDRQTYGALLPNIGLVEKLREYHQNGFEIVIQTSRNMRTYEGNVGKINKHTLPVIIDWLKRHDIPFDEIYVGKPWCGYDGFYIDDRAIRPSEMIKLSYEDIIEIIGKEKR